MVLISYKIFKNVSTLNRRQIKESDRTDESVKGYREGGHRSQRWGSSRKEGGGVWVELGGGGGSEWRVRYRNTRRRVHYTHWQPYTGLVTHTDSLSLSLSPSSLKYRHVSNPSSHSPFSSPPRNNLSHTHTHKLVLIYVTKRFHTFILIRKTWKSMFKTFRSDR